jgi:hypothetical protein
LSESRCGPRVDGLLDDGARDLFYIDTITLHGLYAFFAIEHATAERTSSASPRIPPVPGSTNRGTWDPAFRTTIMRDAMDVRAAHHGYACGSSDGNGRRAEDQP